MTLEILPGVEHRSEDFDLDPALLEDLWRMEDRHFWHRARIRWILWALGAYGAQPGAHVLDVGCGGGRVALSLHAAGYRVTGIDTAEVLVRKANERCPLATFVAGSIAALPAERGPFDVVAFFDVLEHLDAPEALIATALRYARRGALVVATVPGLRALHSAIDDLSGHKKRYEAGELGALFDAAGLAHIEEYGFFRVLRPLLALSRFRARVPVPADPEARRRLLLEDARVPAPPLNWLLDRLCAAELRLGVRRARGKPGPSLLAVGRVVRGK
jgi:2-polyprenyl-3-methyl-5-hydroxy-6-metoxy-1,4-benzoquinol methylase